MGIRFFLLGLLALICSDLKAQTGNYFLSHYSPLDERIDFRSHDMVQDAQGEIYFANKAGILEFDGLNWKVISVPGAAYCLSSSGSEVLIGGLTGIGKLSEKRQSPRSYKTFSDSPGVFSCAQDKSKAYFCSEGQLIIYSLTTQSIEATIEMNLATGKFLGVFNLGDEVVVRAERDRLYKIQDKKLVTLDFAFSNLIFSTPSPSLKSYLIGTRDNRIFIRQDRVMKEVTLQQRDFLKHNILVDGVWVSESMVALGTLRGGVIFIDVVTGATVEVVDYSGGLPDNEVFSLMTDRNDGVWVAHEYGFTRIAPSLPFRSYSHYSGLEGNLLCVQSFKDKVYVGTTLGLFFLTGIPKASFDSTYQPSSAYTYQRVKAIDGKVTQLLEIEGSLFAAGSSGVFEVNGLNVKPMITEPVRNIYKSSVLNQVLVSNLNEQVRTFMVMQGRWKETHLLDTLQNNISHIFEDKLENIWLCGSTLVYKIESVDSQITDIIRYPIQNPTRDEILGLAYGSEVYVVSSGQFKRFNGSGFEKYDSLSGGRRYFTSAGNFWFNDGTKWRTVDRKFQSMKLEWLGVFPNLRYLAPVNDKEGLWAITDKNELYKFINNKVDTSEVLYPLFLREVRGHEIKLTQKVEVEQSEGAFTFEFIRPDYIGAHATQYRYQVKGLSTLWSSWSSSNNVINFSYLPAGTYQLSVQSKDVLGVESNIEQITFRVLPPYWKRWWFYALEFAVLSFLVSISIRLAKGDARYKFISQILSLLTIIMLIQFIQTAIHSLIDVRSSPVLEFFIQVCIALVVFPVEMVARKAMHKVKSKYTARAIQKEN